jgi:hypothetical protein
LRIKDSFDYPLVVLAAGLAGIGQWSNQNPSFGQEMGGFGKRFITGFADQSLGNVMTEGLFPSVLHEDPRYYRRGSGGTWSRTAYALSRLFVTPTDSGGMTFNYSEWAGNATAPAISNVYYPDGRTAGANLGKLGMQIGLDGFALVLKEFWPDIQHDLFEYHHAAAASCSGPFLLTLLSCALPPVNAPQAALSLAPVKQTGLMLPAFGPQCCHTFCHRGWWVSPGSHLTRLHFSLELC